MRGARATAVVYTADDSRLAPLSRVADFMGVPRSTMHAWAKARDLNGFPEPARTGAVITGHAEADLYDIDEVRAWRHFGYRPSRGVSRKDRSGDPTRVGPAAVARALGVTTKSVARWIERRESTGCPEPGEDGKYSLAEWLGWHAQWQARPMVVAARNRKRAA